MTKHHILVVDDDPGIRLAVSLKLRSAGFRVSEATDGVEAMEFFAKDRADLAVLDVGMPRKDGYTVAQELHSGADTSSIPVVILTAQDMSMPEDVQRAIGRHAFLAKPFSPRQLVAVVTELLASDS